MTKTEYLKAKDVAVFVLAVCLLVALFFPFWGASVPEPQYTGCFFGKDHTALCVTGTIEEVREFAEKIYVGRPSP